MNYYISLLLLFTVSSCYGTNRVVENQSEKSQEISQVVTPEKQEILELNDAPKLEAADELETEVEGPGPSITHQIGDFIEDIEIVEAFDHSVFNNLLKKHVSSNGNVNYNGFSTDKSELRNYIKLLGENMPNATWTKEDKLAYWINAYNALTIDLILRNPGTKSIKDIDDPWDQALWKLGNKYYDLNGIEHDVLRKMNEPRIHFAIVCASVSCPKLQNTAFTASDLDTQLTNATKEFLSDSSKNNVSVGKLELSKIFKWFSKDFKQSQSLIDFLNAYSDIEISSKSSIRYKDYDWNLND